MSFEETIDKIRQNFFTNRVYAERLMKQIKFNPYASYHEAQPMIDPVNCVYALYQTFLGKDIYDNPDFWQFYKKRKGLSTPIHKKALAYLLDVQKDRKIVSENPYYSSRTKDYIFNMLDIDCENPPSNFDEDAKLYMNDYLPQCIETDEEPLAAQVQYEPYEPLNLEEPRQTRSVVGQQLASMDELRSILQPPPEPVYDPITYKYYTEKELAKELKKIGPPTKTEERLWLEEKNNVREDFFTFLKSVVTSSPKSRSVNSILQENKDYGFESLDDWRQGIFYIDYIRKHYKVGNPIINVGKKDVLTNGLDTNYFEGNTDEIPMRDFIDSYIKNNKTQSTNYILQEMSKDLELGKNDLKLIKEYINEHHTPIPFVWNPLNGPVVALKYGVPTKLITGSKKPPHLGELKYIKTKLKKAPPKVKPYERLELEEPKKARSVVGQQLASMDELRSLLKPSKKQSEKAKQQRELQKKREQQQLIESEKKPSTYKPLQVEKIGKTTLGKAPLDFPLPPSAPPRQALKVEKVGKIKIKPPKAPKAPKPVKPLEREIEREVYEFLGDKPKCTPQKFVLEHMASKFKLTKLQMKQIRDVVRTFKKEYDM